MEYSNPKISEGINTSKEHPLKDFFLLSLGVFGSLIIILLILGIVADKLAHYLPYSIEQDSTLFVTGSNDPSQPVVAYLQNLANKISQTQELPDSMPITIYYSDAEVVNAYATLGGNVVFFRGLLEKIPNENALAMVMAHEIAHVKHRHPIRSLGSGIIIGLIVSIISNGLGDDIVGKFIGTTGSITNLKFNRNHEIEADNTAIRSVKAVYGHTRGADALFRMFQEQEGKNLEPEFLRTHPATDSRIAQLQTHSGDNIKLTTTALPEHFQIWLNESKTNETNHE